MTKNAGKKGGTEHPYLRVANVYANELRLDDIAVIDVRETELQRVLLEAGDLLIVEGNGSLEHIGRVAIWDGSISPCVHQNHLIKARCAEPALRRWLLHWLLSPEGRAAIVAEASSTSGLHTLSLSKVERLPCRVAPLRVAEQTVGELDSYLSRLDAAVVGLERVQANLKRYRASVLKAAVEGRLVPIEAELAKAEGRTYEPASELLARILEERRARWEAAELASMKAKGKPPKDDKWKAKYQEPAAPDTQGLPALPEGWCWASPAQVFSWSSGNFLPKKNQRPGAIPIYGGNGVNGTHCEALVSAPTIVIGRVGAHCGNVHLTDGPAWITDNAIFATVSASTAVLPFWQLALSSRNLNANSAGTGQPYVNQAHINDLVVPFPPHAEQIRIVGAFDAAASLADATLQSVGGQIVRCARLRQSILKWAFEGRLVDQDPNDEPASVLLERIRAEREATAPAKKRLDPSSTALSQQAPTSGVSLKTRRRKKASAA